MTYEAGPALCLKLGRHFRASWSSKCRRCGKELAPEEAREAAHIAEAMRDLRAEQEAADLYPDNEWDVRSRSET